MSRDPRIPQWAINELAWRRHRERQREAAFIRRLPDGYPTPRLKLEWQAYYDLRRFWKRPQIRQFIASYGTDHALWPGTLNRDEHPKLEEFLRDVGTLAEGEYARSLPRQEMLSILSGEDAVRGAKTIRAASEGGKKRSRLRAEDTAERNRQMVEEYQQQRRKVDFRSDSAIMRAIGKKHGVGRIQARTIIKQGLK